MTTSKREPGAPPHCECPIVNGYHVAQPGCLGCPACTADPWKNHHNVAAAPVAGERAP